MRTVASARHSDFRLDPFPNRHGDVRVGFLWDILTAAPNPERPERRARTRRILVGTSPLAFKLRVDAREAFSMARSKAASGAACQRLWLVSNRDLRVAIFAQEGR